MIRESVDGKNLVEIIVPKFYSFESIKRLCDREAEKVSVEIYIPDGQIIRVPFWTNDGELVCVGEFWLAENSVAKYKLDFSQTTI